MTANKNTAGFTLIEIMVVVAIVAIVATIAYPSYLQQVMRSTRSDARIEVNDVAQRLQRCFTSTSSYAPLAGVCGVVDELNGSGIVSREGFYRVTAVLTPTTYTLTVTAIADRRQNNDENCRRFILDQTGVRTAFTSADNDNTDECW